MDNRQAIGSWLSGPRAAMEDAGADFGYRGEQLGLPEEGPGSIARPGRRTGALVVDWTLCVLIAYGLITDGYNGQTTSNWALLVFFVLSVFTVGTVGFTPGKRLFGLRVVAVDSGRVQPVRGLVRSALLCLAVPALIFPLLLIPPPPRLARTVEVRV
ncbi:RDD family protein [Streptomyces sp. NPDC058632]|uniref:RDD family protein n=1 Tax=Streptomyces sp. NPDC058632 TaxID=3346567 RepID=UPI0036535D82